MKYQLSFEEYKIYSLRDCSLSPESYVAVNKNKTIYGESIEEVKQKLAKLAREEREKRL